MSHRTLRLLAAALVAGGVALAAGTPVYADPTPSPTTTPSPGSTPSPSSTTPTTPAPTSPSPTSPTPTSEPEGHDLRIGGGLWRGHVGQDVGATAAVTTDAVPNDDEKRYTIGIEIVAGARVRTPCDRVSGGFCWFDKTSTRWIDSYTFRFSLRTVGTHVVDIVVRPVGFPDPDPGNNRGTMTFVVTEPATGHDMSVTEAVVRAPVGEEVTAHVLVDRAGVGNYAFVFRYDPARVTYLGPCEERREVGKLIECLNLPPSYHGSVHYLKFKVLVAGDTVVPVEVRAGRGEDPNLKNNTTTVTIKGLAPEGQGGGDDDLPVTGAPVAMVAGTGAGLLATGLVLFGVARRRKTTSAPDLAA